MHGRARPQNVVQQRRLPVGRQAEGGDVGGKEEAQHPWETRRSPSAPEDVSESKRTPPASCSTTICKQNVKAQWKSWSLGIQRGSCTAHLWCSFFKCKPPIRGITARSNLGPNLIRYLVHNSHVDSRCLLLHQQFAWIITWNGNNLEETSVTFINLSES